MAGLIDFMHNTLFDGGLRGRFIAQIKNPKKTNDDVAQWFKGEGYDISEAEIEGLRQINNDHEAVSGPAKPVPYY
ncbi:MAG: hypothetical protein P8X68_04650 [Desulfobacterales bacterium]|jgi:hypothetical protein